MKNFKNYFKSIVLVFALSSFATIKAQTCAANFVYGFNQNGVVNFTNTSTISNTNTVNYVWTFGNNTSTNTTGNAQVTYTANGQYVVTLFLLQSSPTCTASITQTVNVTNIPACPLNSGFNITQGSNGLVTFNNTSSGTSLSTSYSWNFGDGSAIATTSNAVHTYTANGNYTATLTVANNLTCTSTFTTFVAVNSICAINASFNYTQGANGSVSLASTSTGTTGSSVYFWNLGNGTSYTTGPNTSHTYVNGIYTVALVVSGGTLMPSCADTAYQTISVSNNTCLLSAGFTYSVAPNGVVSFSNTTTNTLSLASFSWNFGGNNWSNLASPPPQTYLTPGTYTVILYSTLGGFSCVSSFSTIINVPFTCSVNASYNYTTGPNGQVNFASTSTGTTSSYYYFWNFGDGSSQFGGPTISHNYGNGNFNASLIVMNDTLAPTCIDTTFQLIAISNNTCNLNPNFNANVTPNGVVNFNNTSTGTISTTTFTWNFGDGSGPTNANSPIHTYLQNGVYTVTLVANTNGTCTNSYSALVNVNTICTLNASFTTTLGANGLVNFASTSTGTTGATVYYWNFGDGTALYSGPTISHNYANGSFNANLVILSSTTNATCQDSTSQPITVTTNTCTLSAGFTYTLGANGFVTFINTSTGTTSSTSYTWNFGNGFTSNVANPSLAYLSGGNYNVTLLASNASNCNSNQTSVVSVTTMPCVANANFSLVPTSTPQYWNAIPSSPWNIANSSWNWGDGSISDSTLFTSHQYTAAGMYSICLTVTATCGATAQACASYSVFKPSPGGGIINVNVTQPPLQSIDNISTVGIVNLQKGAPAYEIYPNPSAGSFNLKFDGITGDRVTITVYSVVGKLLHNTTVETTNGKINQEINLTDASNGIYFVQIQSGEDTYTRKLIINK